MDTPSFFLLIFSLQIRRKCLLGVIFMPNTCLFHGLFYFRRKVQLDFPLEVNYSAKVFLSESLKSIY